MKLNTTVGGWSPVWLPPTLDTVASSVLIGSELLLPIQTTSETGFDHEAMNDGEVAMAIEEEGPMAFFLIKFRSPRQLSYLMTPFDAMNTPSPMSLHEAKKASSLKIVILIRIWTQNSAGIIQSVRQTSMPASLQNILMPIITRHLTDREIGWEESKALMLRFMQRAGCPALAFEKCCVNERIF